MMSSMPRMPRIVLNSNLVEIEVGDQADVVSGLRLRTLTGVEFRATARHYVLAAGGIENPRLLLASTGRFPAGVGNGEDLVGRYFLEHPRFIGGTFVPFDPELDSALLPDARRRRLAHHRLSFVA